jgi:hypothetical protein
MAENTWLYSKVSRRTAKLESDKRAADDKRLLDKARVQGLLKSDFIVQSHWLRDIQSIMYDEYDDLADDPISTIILDRFIGFKFQDFFFFFYKFVT